MYTKTALTSGRSLLGAALATMTLAALNACGGGGYSSNSSPMPVQAPMPVQDLQWVSAPAQPWCITPTDPLYDGNFSLTVSCTPGGMMVFKGQMANTSVLTLAVSATVVSTEDTTAYYLTNPYAPLGFSGTTNGVAWTATVTSFTPIPATLTVGTSGPLLSANYRDSLGNVIGSLTETYTVTAVSSTALDVNINSAGTLNGTPVSSTSRFLVTSTGTIYLTEVQITVNATPFDFRGV